MGTVLGIHTYNFVSVPEVLDWIQRARPRVLKTADLDETILRRCRNASPDMLIVGRLWCEHQLYRDDPRKQAHDFCQKRLLPVAKRLRNLVDAWEGFNEAGCAGPEDLAAYALFEAERTWHLAEAGFRSVVGNFAAGAPGLEDWQHFEPALRAAQVTGGFLGLHEWSAPALTSWTAWDPDHPDTEHADEGWLTLRYRKVYRRSLPADLDLPLIITECGIDGSVMPETPRPGGWRNFTTPEAYLQQLAWYDGELQKDPYVVAACVSMYGGGASSWDSYDIKGEVAARLADYIAAHASEPWPGRAQPLTDEQRLLAALTAEFGEQFVDDRRTLPQKGEYTRRPLDAIRCLVIHHTGAGTTFQTPSDALAQSQMRERGWPAINYHFLVYPDQVRYVGSSNTVRPHVHGHNDETIGIALVGDLDSESPPLNAIILTARLCNVLERLLGRSLARHGHRDLATTDETSCPGNTAYGPEGWLARVVSGRPVESEAKKIALPQAADTDAVKTVPQQVNLPLLRQALARYFSEGELRDLCFDIGVSYDSLPGQGSDKARELIAYLDRRGRIPELVDMCRQLRPNAFG